MMSVVRQSKTSPLVETEVLGKSAITVKTMPEERYSNLLSYDYVPEWYQDNGFIRQGHHSVTNSMCACCASWLYLYNGPVNVYFHLLLGILFQIREEFES